MLGGTDPLGGGADTVITVRLGPWAHRRIAELAAEHMAPRQSRSSSTTKACDTEGNGMDQVDG
jgi:hypothetical protein